DRIAECAYATDAAMDHVIAARPGLADKPTVLVGMSGGAMALPTVYAYRPDRYDSAVLIAGGANFLRIMIESNYRDWIDAIILDFDPSSPLDNGKPTAGQVQRLSELYLGKSRLDAYHTAAEMSRIPVLMLHATNDRAVPAALGNILHQRLAEPERWTYPLGHELIFAGLPTQIARIDRWLTEHVLEAMGGPTVTESPSGESSGAADSE
ncbi:MAG: alpha/beta hydrolase, partial [Phycisphaerales bacterium]